jgi:hypothetical protein
MFTEEYPERASLASVTDRVDVPDAPEMLVRLKVGVRSVSVELAVKVTVPENRSRLSTVIVAVPDWPALIVRDSVLDARLKSGPMTWTLTYA